MMQRIGSSTTLKLTELEVGHRHTLVMTNVTQAVTIQFQHCGTGAWHNLPPGALTPSAEVIVHEFTCVSPTMRISLAAANGKDYAISLVTAATAEF
jgi:hypothetical protein